MNNASAEWLKEAKQLKKRAKKAVQELEKHQEILLALSTAEMTVKGTLSFSDKKTGKQIG